jgi:hypothetical protein
MQLLSVLNIAPPFTLTESVTPASDDAWYPPIHILDRQGITQLNRDSTGTIERHGIGTLERH